MSLELIVVSPHAVLLAASSLIDKDIRNNSAWNERWFTVHRGKIGGGAICLDEAQAEAEFVMTKILMDPYNESTWQYLMSILKEQLSKGDRKSAMAMVAEYANRVNEFRDMFSKAGQNSEKCVNMTAAHIDLLDMMGDKKSLQKVCCCDVSKSSRVGVFKLLAC